MLKLSVDSPFRYKSNVRVSPHIKAKVFGEDVLLFASPRRLQKEAVTVLRGDISRSKAFWEVFTKRVNESIHLLTIPTLCQILKALESGNATPSLLSGVCHFIREDICTIGCGKYQSINDIITIMKFLSKFSTPIEINVFLPIVKRITDLVYQVKGKVEMEELLEEISKIRPKMVEITAIEALLARKISRRINIQGKRDPFLSLENPSNLLV